MTMAIAEIEDKQNTGTRRGVRRLKNRVDSHRVCLDEQHRQIVSDFDSIMIRAYLEFVQYPVST